MSQLEDAQEQWETATDTFHRVVPAVTLAAIRLMALRCLDAYPQATHMLIESSDQGRYMCGPLSIEVDGVTLLEDDPMWEFNEEHELDSVASYLSWGDDTWEDFTDMEHPFTRTRAGYYAMDLALIVAGLPV
jgi:hypothetical protein